MKRTIYSLQVFRGLAALAVVCHHAAISTAAFVAPLPEAAHSVFSLGYLGIDFFFVLSGFIIMYTHMHDEGSLSSVRKYSYKRLVRIFPAYLPISIGMILLYSLMPGFSASGGREFSILSSLFLLPAENPPALSVAWTLVHELMFYFIFLLFFVSSRIFVVALILWGSIIIYANVMGENIGWLRYPLSILNLEFMLGVIAAWYVKSRTLPCSHSYLIAGGVILSIFCLAFISDWNEIRVGFAMGLALIVVGFSFLELTVSIRWPSILLLLGNASYSIYLIHNPLLSIIQRLIGWLDFGWELSMLFGVIISSLVGTAYYLLIEKKSLGYFRSKLNRS